MSRNKRNIFLTAALSISAFFGAAAMAPKQADKMTDMPFANSLNQAVYDVTLPYATQDDILLTVRQSSHSIHETNWAGEKFSFHAARPGDAALWRDTLTGAGALRYYTEGAGDDKTFTTYAPGMLNSVRQKEHDRLIGIYNTVVGARPSAIPANADLKCEKPAGDKIMFCRQW
jgi:hypothetical protein